MNVGDEAGVLELRPAFWQRAQRRRMGRGAEARRGRYRDNGSRIYFRADAGFAIRDVFEFLEREIVMMLRGLSFSTSRIFHKTMAAN
jgi:hypothetical protein